MWQRQNRPEDLWLFVKKAGPDDCWPWLRGKSKDGYGQLGVAGKVRYTHILAFELAKEPANGRVIRHLCGNKACCNPNHLKAGTQEQNARDAILAGSYKAGASGRVGVTYIKSRQRYSVRVREDNESVQLYWGSDFEEACRIREAWERQLEQ